MEQYCEKCRIDHSIVPAAVQGSGSTLFGLPHFTKKNHPQCTQKFPFVQ